MLFDSSIWILFMAVCRIMPGIFRNSNQLTLQSQSPTFSYTIVCTRTQRYSPKTKITQSSSLRITSMPWKFATRLPSIWPNPWELSLKKTTKSRWHLCPIPQERFCRGCRPPIGRSILGAGRQRPQGFRQEGI
jgi:hypothetical protein